MPECRIVNDLGSLSPKQWSELDFNNNPFLSYAFLQGLEQYQCLSHQYWHPQHLVIEEHDRLLGVMPLYIKQDSYGEFVFDWAWADACQRAGRQYYPKLVSAIPFTPVSGSRLLINRSADREVVQDKLINAAKSFMGENSFSSLHVLFPDTTSVDALIRNGGMRRLTCQFHWFNNDYRDFSDFTDALTSKKRKQILKERRAIADSSIEIERLTGENISDEQWQVFYQFYCATFYKKWGEPRLTLDFFKSLSRNLADNTLLVLARENGEYIAGAFAMMDNETLYGRHWGCRRQVPFLHFELCYYQTIEFAIEKKLKKLDAGVQGEHKLARGFQPVALPSSHWIRETDFADAVAAYLEVETRSVEDHIEMLKQHMPYKQAG